MNLKPLIQSPKPGIGCGSCEHLCS